MLIARHEAKRTLGKSKKDGAEEVDGAGRVKERESGREKERKSLKWSEQGNGNGSDKEKKTKVGVEAEIILDWHKMLNTSTTKWN